MAQVRLERHEAEGGYLPPVCMRCGAEATWQRRQDFKAGNAAGTPVQTWVIAPLCDAHRGHWRIRALAVPLTLIALGIGFCGGMIGAIKTDAGAATAQIIFLATGTGFIGWVVMSALLHYTSIRLRTFDFDSLELTGVAEEFAEAVAKHRLSPEHEKPLALEGAGSARRQVRLGRHEVNDLPAVCVCCGAPATERVVKTYRGRTQADTNASSFVGLLSFLVLGVGWISSMSVTRASPWNVRLPVCAAHRSYWAHRWLLILGALGLLVAAVWAGMLLADKGAGWVCFGGFLGFLLWYGFTIYVRETMIQPAETTELTLVLKHVSNGFVEAVDRDRRQRGAPPV
ncbi:hypothetical protein AYO44_00310 [Planctomycetaceae bacterium SCGC AG-212-F19]|nr:hypothetical protein AYO44_00310 [Planctomycetaceae bacterium SCGC AG-212-F19]